VELAVGIAIGVGLAAVLWSAFSSQAAQDAGAPQDTPFQTKPVQDVSGEDLPIGGTTGMGPAAIEQWRPLAEQYAQVNSILDPNEILAIVWNESSGDPKSFNKNDPSWGLMGVQLLIGRKFASVSDSTELSDPETNIKAGSGFLAYLKSNYEDRFPLTDPQNGWVQMYNAGEPRFLSGAVRATRYQADFLAHLAALGG